MAIQPVAPFLTGEEYGIGQRRTAQIVGDMTGAYMTGQKIRQNQMILEKTQREEAEAQEQKQAAARQQKALDVLIGSELADYENRFGTPAAQSTTVPQPVAPATQQVAPTFAPAEAGTTAPVAQTFPVAPQAATPVSPLPAQPTSMAPSGAAPAPEVAAPEKPLGQDPLIQQTGIAEVATPSTTKEIRALPEVGGQPNRTSMDEAKRDYIRVKALIESGQISQADGVRYLRQREDIRNKEAERLLALQQKQATLLQTTTGVEKTQLELQRLRDEQNVFGPAFDVYTKVKEGDISGAQATARYYGFKDFDPNNMQQVKEIETLARRSTQWAAAKRESLEERRVAATEARTAATERQVAATERRAAAAEARVNAKESGAKATPTNKQVEEGEVQRDPETGEEYIPFKPKPEQRIEANNAIRSANTANDSFVRMNELYATLVKRSGYNPSDSSFQNNFKNWYDKNIKNDPQLQEYAAIRQRAINDSLRLNKGTQTEGDAQREADALANVGLPPDAHKNVIDRLITFNNGIKESNKAIQRGRLLVNPGAAPSAAPARQAAPSGTPTVSSQAQYDALPSGATYVGPDGRTYRKK